MQLPLKFVTMITYAPYSQFFCLFTGVILIDLQKAFDTVAID